MKFVIKISMITLSMFVSGMVVASPNTSEILLAGGQARYNQNIIISLDQLLANVDYIVSCEIASNHKSKQTFDDIQIFTYYHHSIFSVNGTVLASHGQINIPTNSGVSFVASSVIKEDSYMAIRNLDNVDTIMVSNCVAQPSRS